LGLEPADLAEVLPSGTQTRYANRVAWAHVYLKQAGLLSTPRRGVYQITDRGREVLAAPPEKITTAFLERFPEYLAFKARRSTEEAEAAAPAAPGNSAGEAEHGTLTPDEQIRAGYQLLRSSLAAQLLERVRQASPAFFEKMVVEVLVAMGYGGSQEDAAQVVGKSRDGGIDGIIKEDRLGLENIYVQAKRWEATVGRPIIQQFAGALHGNRARRVW
jgi:restriction system protein